MSELKVSEVLKNLEARAPGQTAADWDNVGLLAGDPGATTTGAVVSVDLTLDSIQKAKSNGFSLIVNHHPCIFPKGRGLSKVTQGNLVFEAIKNGISVIASHTNFDQCALEVVKKVSEGLGVKPLGRLHEHGEEPLMKLVVFTPETHLEAVRDAICEAGAGHIGNYDSCTFGSPGEGTFRGGKDTKPFLGKPGELERAKEVRLETVFPRGLKSAVLSALKKAHPYEEIAFDLYALEQSPPSRGLISGVGYGFWGEFPSPKAFPDFAKDVKHLFKVDGFWLTDPPPAKIRKVAFVAGKGASFVSSASQLGCDIFVTGEVGYHAALDGLRRGMAVMEIGHRESERFFLQTMEEWLSQMGLQVTRLDQATQRIWQEELK